MKAVIYGAVAVVAAAVGFGIYRYALAPHAPVAPVEQAAGPASEPATPEPAAIPANLPDFSLQDREGNLRSIRSWQGKSMIVNFWATWCAPCRREIPLLKEIQKTQGGNGFQVVGVAVDFREDVLKYAGEIGIDYPILIGEQDGLDAVTSFGMGSLGFPFTVFTDNQGRIVLTHLGELTQPQSVIMIDAVNRVNRGELTPDAARAVAAGQLEEIKAPEA
ncbi:thiol-disulfide isomerase/thioredoxin [Povalibacter uvarum]|uniref:Thiol-disulfide isomerase/thioredoxin n=1 Tax=Povalibacter uvarum TaxID=732238 RepID=A0A841HQP6_9GAMM|nr:TlpA disulfide reductase family protein [Povalibacter uvarum]MBB6094649.1 thiol-disulfide isomerase/thioredoxin [Povalibacter uvarum]